MKMNSVKWTWLLWGVVTLIFSGAEAEETRSPLIQVGEAYYVQYCSACHGEDARGKGPAAEALKVAPVDLTVLQKNNQGVFPESRVIRFIDGRNSVSAHGTREMPVWGIRFGQKIAEGTDEEEVTRGRLLILVEYLKSIQQ